MRLRRLTTLASVAAIAVVGFVSAPPAHAAAISLGCENDSKSTSVAVGETLTISVSHCTIQSVSGVGTFTPSAGYVMSTISFNSTQEGTARLTVYGAGVSPSVLTITVGAGGGSSTPTLKASQPPSVTATPGNGVVQLSIGPGTGGDGSAYLYYIEYYQYCTQVICPALQKATVPAGESGFATTIIQGLVNGREYIFRVYEQTTELLWSGATTVSSTPTAASNCSALSIKVAQPGGKDVATVTSPVSGTASPAVYPFIAPPYGGVVKQPALGAWTSATSFGAAGGEYATFTPTTDIPCPITVSAPEGTKLSMWTGGAWNGGSASLTVYSGTPVYVFGTKTGDYTIPFSAGTISALNASPKVRIGTVPQAAYKIAISPLTQDVNVNSFTNPSVTVTDAFDNAVPRAEVALAASGQVLLGGSIPAQKATTDATGRLTATLIAGNTAGSGELTAATPADTTAWAWQKDYVKPSGFPDPVKTASASINVTSSVTKTITITESGRTTVSGKSGVYVTGTATGFTAGDILKVFVRFAGGEYAEGSAKPAISSSGDFEWSRKTGKKTYVYFTNADGTVKSTEVIIPAK